MKLSANAREHVKEQIRLAFADEYNAAYKAIKDYEDAAKARYDKFEADLNKVLGKALEECRKVIAKHGLSPAGDRTEFDEEMHLKLLMNESNYSAVDSSSFRETDANEYREKDTYGKLVAAKKEINRKIEKAASKALFEIEVHGKKSDLEAIVAEVIAEMKKGN